MSKVLIQKQNNPDYMCPTCERNKFTIEYSNFISTPIRGRVEIDIEDANFQVYCNTCNHNCTMDFELING